MVTGDFNNDGKLDLAVANHADGTVSVFPGDGLGGFGTARQSAVGTGGRAMVKLRVAEALAGKQIIFLPGGAKSGGLQTMNLNDLLARYALTETKRVSAKVEDDSK